jgi:DNA-binding LacI/PurR family transcriptional regulator
MTAKRATLRDVAQASGVSPSTVSFVLNGVTDQKISEATRLRVQQAAAALNYAPHAIARALREGSSRIVLLDLDPLFQGASANSYIRGLDAELARSGYVLLVRHGQSEQSDLSTVIDSVRPRAVIDLAGLYGDGHELTEDGGWVDGLAAHTAVQIRHLAERGHTAIAVAVPEDPQRSRLAEARFRFASQAAADLGLAEPVRFDVPGSVGAAAYRLSRLRAEHPGVTALACYDDILALELLRAARDLGIDVPGELAIIGFDATEHGAYSMPTLTSVAIDAESFGRLAARTALGLTTGDRETTAAVIVERDSV